MGQLSATLSGTLDSVRIPWLDNSLNISNIAIGDALRANSQNVSLILFDELDAPFRVSLGSFINNEAMSASRFSSLTSNLKTVNRFSANESGSLKMQFKTRKFSNLGAFNYAYEEALIDQYSAITAKPPATNGEAKEVPFATAKQLFAASQSKVPSS